MEVHAHTHTARKKWTHYFWEFLMLFLAVFCGFIAENLREKHIEHLRAKEFAETLLRDIKKDTTSLSLIIKELDFVVPKIDTFRNLVKDREINDLPGGTWYYYARFTTRYFDFSPQDATIEQLKNSGSLRYFKNHVLETAIAQYYQNWRDLKTRDQYIISINEKILEFRNKIFNSFYFDSLMDLKISREKVDFFMKQPIDLLNTNKKYMIEMSNYCQVEVFHFNRRKTEYQTILNAGNNVLILLKKEYPLE